MKLLILLTLSFSVPAFSQSVSSIVAANDFQKYSERMINKAEDEKSEYTAYCNKTRDSKLEQTLCVSTIESEIKEFKNKSSGKPNSLTWKMRKEGKPSILWEWISYREKRDAEEAKIKSETLTPKAQQ